MSLLKGCPHFRNVFKTLDHVNCAVHYPEVAITMWSNDPASLHVGCPQVLAPPKQKGVYPFFTFADMSMGDVITDSALRQVDISTLGSGSSHQSHNTSDSRSLGADYSDDEFLVVECRTNAAGTLTASLPAAVSPHQVGRDGGSPEDRGSKMQHITLNGSNSTCADNLKT